MFGDFSCSCMAALGGNRNIGKEKRERKKQVKMGMAESEKAQRSVIESVQER